MTRRQPITKLLICLFLVLVLVLSIFLMLRRSLTTIRLHDDQVEIQKFANAMATFIIINGLNYKVELVEATVKEVRGHLLRGDIDITLELWRENNLLWHTEGIKNSLITDLGEIYSGGKQYWIIPKWYADDHKIQTVFDMQDHWQDFLDPDDPSKGLFFNCIVGWTCQDINKVKLQAYGLDRYFNTVSPLSPKSLQSIYTNALARKIPVFGYYWEPNSIMTNHDWHILEEPPYSDETWQQVIAAAADPGVIKLQRACSFNDSGAHKIANSKLASKAPGVYQMVKRMRIDIELVNQIIFDNDRLEAGKLPLEDLAKKFLLDHPEQWSSWVAEDIQNNILKELRSDDQRISTGG